MFYELGQGESVSFITSSSGLDDRAGR